MLCETTRLGAVTASLGSQSPCLPPRRSGRVFSLSFPSAGRCPAASRNFQEGRADGARGAVPREDKHRKPTSPSFIAEHGVPWNIPVVSRGQLSAASPPGFLHTPASSRQGGVRRGRDLDTVRGLVSSSQHIGALISAGFHHKLKT